MTQKLRQAKQWRFTVYDTGEIRQIPSSTRGNESYAYFQSFRLNDIQRQINKRLETDGKTYSNILFQTHTLKYNPEDPEDVVRVWKEGHEGIARFLRKMKKLGMVDYCLALEAFESAGFHIHIAVILDRQVEMYKHVVWSEEKGRWDITYRLVDLDFLDKIRDAWADSVGKPMEEAHSDIQCCYSEKLAGYIIKELKKVSSVESALRRYRKGEETAADVKKITAFYMADKMRIRLLRVSRGLSSAIAEMEKEGTEEPDLIPGRNNLTEGGIERIPLFSMVLTRKQLFMVVDYHTFEPWTGIIDKRLPQYQRIKELFDKRFGFSAFIADKERLKRFIADRNQRIERSRNKRNETQELVGWALSLND